jgi:hypothetical protein
MLPGHLRAAMVVFLPALGSSLPAWQTLAARDDDKANWTPTSVVQNEAPKVKEDRPRGADGSSQKNQPYTAAVEVRDLRADAPIPDAHLEFVYEGAKKTASTDSLPRRTGSESPTFSHYRPFATGQRS